MVLKKSCFGSVISVLSVVKTTCDIRGGKVWCFDDSPAETPRLPHSA